jgi:hypothetical protein
MIHAVACAVALALSQSATAGQQPRFREHVDVRRLLIDVRVLDDRGRAVLGLDAGDFRVRIDGRPARGALLSGRHKRRPSLAGGRPSDRGAGYGRVLRADARIHRARGRAARGALAGYYVLFVERSSDDDASQTLQIELTRAKGNVLAQLSVSRSEGRP